MILGMGIDVVDLGGFRAQLADVASAFVAGTFTPGERDAAASRASGDPARHLAVRFAAKEAFLKALSGPRFGAPPRQRRLDLREIEVISDAWGRPALRLHGAARALLDEGGAWQAHVSLSHDGPFAVACVVLEAA
ncbi:MAG: holo-ACP synthase [Myxococcales bacterium]|nr:holo-ACP synthase [Myxococcales bacterium]